MLTKADACQALAAQFEHLLLPTSPYIWSLQLDPMHKLQPTIGSTALQL